MCSLSVEIVKPDNPIPYQVRYMVLVEENGFIKPDNIPCEFNNEKMEKDDFDDYSFHIVVFSRNNTLRIPVGAARVVLDSDYGLPFYREFSHNIDRKLNFIGEVSRISILKNYQKTKALELIFAVAYVISRYTLNVDCALINANPDTDSICYANNIYMHIAENGSLHPDIICNPINSNSKMQYESNLLIKEVRYNGDLPHMINKYINMNFRVAGFPVYIPKYNMCGMPFALRLNEINARYDRYFRKVVQNFEMPDKEMIVNKLISKGYDVFIQR
jgi:hypothetical protein